MPHPHRDDDFIISGFPVRNRKGRGEKMSIRSKKQSVLPIHGTTKEPIEETRPKINWSNLMVKMLICILTIFVAVSGIICMVVNVNENLKQDRILSGIVIAKYYSPEKDSDGQTTMIIGEMIMPIPTKTHTPAYWFIKIRDDTKKPSRVRNLYVSKETYEKLLIGNMYVVQPGDTNAWDL